MPSLLLTELQARAASCGLNLCGLVDAPRFDRCQSPESRVRRLLRDCGTVVVLGSGGREFWRRLVSHLDAGPAPDAHAVHQHTLRCVGELMAMLGAGGVSARLVQPEDRATLNFVQLAEAAGLGTVSPVAHLLLHPTFGTWVSLRAALLLPGHPFGPVDDASVSSIWQPCSDCPQPCVAACPASMHDGFGGSDFQRCTLHRHAGGCESGCGARRACPIGSEHRYDAEQESLGGAAANGRRPARTPLLRLVPRFLRLR